MTDVIDELFELRPHGLGIFRGDFDESGKVTRSFELRLIENRDLVHFGREPPLVVIAAAFDFQRSTFAVGL